MKIKEFRFLRTLFFGGAKVLSGAGIAFFLVQHGLSLFNITGTFNKPLAFIGACSMGYVILFTQIKPMYRSQMPDVNFITLLNRHPVALLSGYLQAICVGLNAFLGCYTLLIALKVTYAPLVDLISVYGALSNSYAYYAFVMPKIINNTNKYKALLRKKIEINVLVIKTGFYCSTGLLAYSLLALYTTYSATKLLFPHMLIAVTAGMLAFYATFSTFILSRVVAVYEVFKTGIFYGVNRSQNFLFYLHWIVGGIDVVSFCFVSYTGALLAISVLLNHQVGYWYNIILLLPAASAAFLHFCFSILRMNHKS